jgi:hypothetical protein
VRIVAPAGLGLTVVPRGQVFHEIRTPCHLLAAAIAAYEPSADSEASFCAVAAQVGPAPRAPSHRTSPSSVRTPRAAGFDRSAMLARRRGFSVGTSNWALWGGPIVMRNVEQAHRLKDLTDDVADAALFEDGRVVQCAPNDDLSGS